MNAKLRAWNIAFLGLAVAGALVGWIFFDRDPAQLMVVFGALTSSAIGLEAAMVGKRATFKPEATTGGTSR